MNKRTVLQGPLLGRTEGPYSFKPTEKNVLGQRKSFGGKLYKNSFSNQHLIKRRHITYVYFSLLCKFIIVIFTLASLQEPELFCSHDVDMAHEMADSCGMFNIEDMCFTPDTCTAQKKALCEFNLKGNTYITILTYVGPMWAGVNISRRWLKG